MLLKKLFRSLTSRVSFYREIQKQKMFFGSFFILVFVALLFIRVSAYSVPWSTIRTQLITGSSNNQTYVLEATVAFGTPFSTGGSWTTMTIDGNGLRLNPQTNNASGLTITGNKTLNFKNISFWGIVANTANISNDGGVVRITGGAKVNFSGNINFSGNGGYARGGAIYVTGNNSKAIFGGVIGSFDYNKLNYTGANGSGGAVIFIDNNGELSISTSVLQFRNNGGGTTRNGGVIMISGNNGTLGTAHIYNSNIDFSTNTAGTTDGGAIENSGILSIYNSTVNFAYNIGSKGGAIDNWNAAARLYMYSSSITFYANNGRINGGVMYIDSSSEIHFSTTNVTFLENKSPIGGAISVANSAQLKFYAGNAVFNGNTATGMTGSGGAIYAASNSTVTSNNTNLSFSGNKAVIGGAILAASNSNIIFTGGSLIFDNNETTGARGIIYWSGGALVKFVELISLRAVNNKASGGGGFLAIDGASYVLDATTILISNNQVTGTGNGGAIDLTTSKLTFKTANVEISTNKTTQAGGLGGGMYIVSSSVDFTASNSMSFGANEATKGGGIYFMTKSTGIFSTPLLEFYQNKATAGNGGGIYFTESLARFSPTQMIFSGNTASANGGGMYFIASTASFAQSSTMTFIDNKAGVGGTGNGGAMYFINSSATFAADKLMRFVNNQASAEGGAMSFNTANATFSQAENMSFEINYSSTIGGAMYFYRARANFSPTSMTFSNNEAKTSGGGMFFTASTANFAGSTMAFIGNKANTEKGGAMYFVNSSATFAASEVMRFANNQAKTDGGGMYFTLSNALFSQSKEMKFEVNVASGNGGGLAFNNATVLFSPTSMTFANNEANISGGGIYLEAGSISTFSATGKMIFKENRAANGGGMSLIMSWAMFETNGVMTFNDNIALSSGAAIYLDGSTMTFKAATMEFEDNEAGFGAVLYATKGSDVLFTQGSVTFNNNVTLSGNGIIAWDDGSVVAFTKLQNLLAIYNKANEGGFLYIENANYTMDSRAIQISSNQAVRGVGGAIYLKGSSLTFSVDNGKGRLEIATNTAATNGGGIYLEEGNTSSKLGFNAGTISFSKNVANSSGGAIYLQGSTITFAAGQMKFEKNEANIGAVLYATNNSWVVFKEGAVEIKNNESKAGRGVVSWDGGSQVSFTSLENLIATDNKAPEGGFLYIDGADYKLGSAEINISSNEARTGNGGAIYLQNSMMTFEAKQAGGDVKVRFLGNNARQGVGGAIYADQGSLITLDTGIGAQGEIVFSGNKANGIANDIYISNSEIVLNAYEAGKGIWLMGGIKAVEGSTVSMKGAGKLYLSGVTDFNETEFKLETGNTVIITNEGNFTYSNASKGIELSSSAMLFEKAQIRFEGNKEGSIIAQYGSSISFMKSRSDMNFSGNKATRAGIVIRATGGSTVTFRENSLKIEDNGDLEIESSIIYWDETSQINFEGSRVTGKNNKAKNGVFVKLEDRQWKVSRYALDMTGGQAGENGGVIYADRSTVTLNTDTQYISFSNNRAGGELNDIYLRNSVLELDATNEEIYINSGIKTQGTFKLIKTGEADAVIGGIVNIEESGEWLIKNGRIIVNAMPRNVMPGQSSLQSNEALIVIESMIVEEPATYSMIGKDIVVTSVTKEIIIKGTIEIAVEPGLDQGNMVADRIYASTITIVEGSHLKLALYGGNSATDLVPIMYSDWGIFGVDNLVPVYESGFFYSFDYDDIYFPKQLYVRLQVPKIDLENLTHNQKEVVEMINQLKELDEIEYRLPITRRIALGDGIAALQGLDEMSGEFLANALSMGARENNKVIRHAYTKEKGIWLEGNLNGFQYNREGNYNGAFKGNTQELQAGVDLLRTKETSLGMFIGYADNNISQGKSRANIRDSKIGIYVGGFGEFVSFAGSLSGALQQLDIERYVQVKEEKPRSNFNTYSIRFSGELDYKYILDTQRQFYVKPFVGVNAGIVFNSKIEEENGKTSDLIIEANNYMRVEGNFGIKIELKAKRMRYNGRLYGEYLLMGNKSEYEIGMVKLPDSGRMNIWGVEGKQVLGGIGIGAEYEATRNIGIYANTDFKSSLNTFVYFVNGGIKYKFGTTK